VPAAYDDGGMDVVSRRLLIAPLVTVAGLAWTGAPAVVATAQALDHPAWSDPDVDHPLGPVPVDETSWWPPGRRYEWIGQSTGETIVRIDPWGSATAGHVWTAGVVASTGFLGTWLWNGTRPLPRLRRPRRVDHRRCDSAHVAVGE
jgi:hypothetical protein